MVVISKAFFLCFCVTVCPRSSYTFYIVSYYIKWVTTSWTYSIYNIYYIYIFLSGANACSVSYHLTVLCSGRAEQSEKYIYPHRVARVKPYQTTGNCGIIRGTIWTVRLTIFILTTILTDHYFVQYVQEVVTHFMW